MENLSDECVLSEYTMYFLCPGNEDAGWDEEKIAGLVGVFDTAQKDVVGDFLRSIMEREELRYWHPYVEQGLKWWLA